MEAIEMQQQFFSLLKNSLPAHVSMADELAGKLGLSYDSVYRRIRGEKPLSMAELKLLCETYQISLDQVLNLQSDNVLFRAPDINHTQIPFPLYIQGMLAQMKIFNSFDGKKMRYLCKDMTFFHFYHFPGIEAKFSLKKDEFVDCFQIGQQVIREYNQIPSVELWNVESVNSTHSQIQYYYNAGLFETREDMIGVIESLQQTLDHLQLQVEQGVKFMPGDPDTRYQAGLQFYINEVVLGSNTILIESDQHRESLVTYSVLNYMSTKDTRFCDKAFSSFDNLLSRSTPISATGEKERNRFFHRLKERLEALKAI
ncbi:MAG: helix-turn-helix domain-containing protein [Sphingobacteriales bacterium]|nr:helix-turn-helix domain-containing protein [Sphingobacteriales bacterium]